MDSIECLEHVELDGTRNATYALPSADINGIGVFLAFSIGPLVSWLLAILFYAFGLVPPEILNQFDQLFVKVRLRKSRFSSDFRTAVVTFGDQQIVVAFGTLVAGLVGMRHSTPFDYQTIVYLGWMLSNMQLSALSMTRYHFRERPLLRALRITAMLCLLITLCVALYPTTNFLWADSVLNKSTACPSSATCPALNWTASGLWDKTGPSNRTGGLAPQGVLGYAIVVTGYMWQAAKLFQPSHTFLNQIARKPLSWLERTLPRLFSQRVSNLYRIGYRLLLGLYMFLLVFLDLVSSHAFHLFLLLVSIAWGSFQLFEPRFVVLPPCIRDALSKWEFGQILPMLLFLSPIYGIASHYLGERPSQVDSQENPEDSDSLSTTKMQATSIPKLEISKQFELLNSATAMGDLLSADKLRRELHATLHSTPQFKTIASLLCTIIFTTAAGYFLAISLAYLNPHEPLGKQANWWQRWWQMPPILLAGSLGFVTTCIISLASPFLSIRLSS